MSKLWLTIIAVCSLIIIGILIGWFWCKSTFKPIIIQRPSQTIYETQWKTNTVTKRDTIQKRVQIIKWKDRPVYVYAIVDTTFNNIREYKNFLQENNIDSKDIISFKVETIDSVKAYADTTFNRSYLVYKQSLRIKDFVYKPAPIDIRPYTIASKFQAYSGMNLFATKTETVNNNILNKQYEFIPSIFVAFVIGQKYQINLHGQLNGFGVGVGMKFIDWK